MTEDASQNDNFKFRMTEWRGYVTARLEDIAEQQDVTLTKVDKLLTKSEDFITTDEIDNRFVKQKEICTSQFTKTNSNPDIPATVQLLTAGWRGLGILGALFVTIGGLLIIILKLVGV